MIRIGAFNLKSDGKQHIIDTFHAFVENVLQSHQTLDLKDPAMLFIRVLSPEHMAAIRRRQNDLRNDLNVINTGLIDFSIPKDLPSIYHESFMFNVPQNYKDESGEYIFKDYCLVTSIVLGKISFKLVCYWSRFSYRSL